MWRWHCTDISLISPIVSREPTQNSFFISQNYSKSPQIDPIPPQNDCYLRKTTHYLHKTTANLCKTTWNLRQNGSKPPPKWLKASAKWLISTTKWLKTSTIIVLVTKLLKIPQYDFFNYKTTAKLYKCTRFHRKMTQNLRKITAQLPQNWPKRISWRKVPFFAAK